MLEKGRCGRSPRGIAMRERFSSWAAAMIAAIALSALACSNSAQDTPEAEPEIAVLQGDREIASGETISFGSVVVSDSKDLVITVANSGQGSLVLSGDGVTLGGADVALFSIPEPWTSPVEAGTTMSFSIRFAPTSIGSKSATLSLTCNDEDEGTSTFTLGGVCTATPEPEICLRDPALAEIASGGSYAFAETMVSRYSDAEFTIENIGSAALNLDGSPKVAISGTGASSFTITSQPDSPIAVSESASFIVRFEPGSIGAKSATLSIASDDLDEDPYTISLSGDAIEWHGVQAVDTDGTVGQYASIAVDGSNVFISYYDGTNGDLKFAKSSDGGATWPSGDIVTVDSSGNVGYWTAIAASGSTVIISYLDVTNNDLKFARSTDGGASWPAGNIVTVDDGAIYSSSSLAMSGSTVHLCYYADGDLKYAQSTDGGATWPSGNKQTLFAPASTIVGVDSSMALVGSSIYVSYGDSTNDDVLFIRSQDSGSTWTDNQYIEASGQAGMYSDIAVSGSDVYVAYVAGNDTRFTKSADGGETWSPANIVTVDSISYSTVPTISLTIADGALCIARGIYVWRSSDGGATWPSGSRVRFDETLSGNDYVSLAASGSEVYIGYYSINSGDLKFAKSLDGGVSW
jgi:hypothetical protein